MTKKRRRHTQLFTSLLMSLLFLASSSNAAVLRGQVFDQETGYPLRGASVTLIELSEQAATDSLGFCYLDGLPDGVYTLFVSFVGYRSDTITDILISNADTTFFEAGLLPQPTPGPDISVHSRKLPYQEAPSSGSNVTLTPAEISGAAGAVGDPVRSLSILPSMARYDDRFNSLVIRGGSPIENGIWIDHIPLPSLNHFSTSGTTGGVISLLNADMLNSAKIYLAGFPAAYPDRLSSIWDIKLREGNRQRRTFQLEAGVSGLEVVAETPVLRGRGSAIYSLRRSFLDKILERMNVDVIPEFWDTHGKLAFDVDSSNHVDLIFLYGSSRAELTSVPTSVAGSDLSGGTDVATLTTGLHWRRGWRTGLLSNISLSYSDSHHENRSNLDDFDDATFSNSAIERTITGFWRNRWEASKTVAIDFGWSVRRLYGWYNYDFEDLLSPIPGPVIELKAKRAKQEWRFGSYGSCDLKLASSVTVTLGLRSDYLSHRDKTVLSPRSSIQLKLGVQTSLSGSAGLYHQSLPGILTYQQESFEQLKTPKARHFTLGLQRSLRDNLDAKLEVYHKQYYNQPLFPMSKPIYVLDDLISRYGHFNSYDTLVDNGEASSLGVEFVFRGNLLSSRLQFLLGGAVSRMRYSDSAGTLYDRVADNQYTVGIEGRYHISREWTFSLRWNLAGGTPYTPFDIDASRRRQTGVLDVTRFLAERLPDYQALNIRIQRSFSTGSSQLIVFVSIWNLYDHNNVSGYYWDKDADFPIEIKQLGFLPLGGLKFIF